MRHEWLDRYIIKTIEEAQDFATQWLGSYNNDRPNMGIGGMTPAQKLKWSRKFYEFTPFQMGDYRPIFASILTGPSTPGKALEASADERETSAPKTHPSSAKL